jgi:gliding motility-associated-like protein
MIHNSIKSDCLHIRLSITCLLFIGALGLQAQDFSRHNWYFGNSENSILFNKSDNQARRTDGQATVFGSAGAAVATDRISGDLLFYTDGGQVFDASHQLMEGWSPLTGNPDGSQNVVITPTANNSGQFFVFTNTAAYPAPGSVFFSTIDMDLPGNATPPQPNLGEVTAINNPAALPDGIQVNPGMLAFEVGNDPYLYFLLVQNAANRDFHLYLVGETNRVLLKTITNPTGLIAANFDFNRSNGQIAVSPQNQGVNVQMLQFDLSADTLSFQREIPGTGNFDGPNEAVFDVEFAPNDTIIFISRFGGATQEGALYRYDLSNPTASLDQVNPDPLYRSYGLQIGPDGSIYHLYQSSPAGGFEVGRIVNPNAPALSGLVYQPEPLGSEDYNGVQFPSFAPKASLDVTPGFEVVAATTCERTPTKFYPTFDPPASSYVWDFGEPGNPNNVSNMVAPIFTYSAPGTYEVRLIAGFNGTVDTVFQEVTVEAVTDSIDLGQDTVICPNETLQLDAGNNWDLIRWSIPGETGSTVTVDSSNVTGFIYVVATQGSCTAYDGINIEEYGEEIQNANYWYFGNNAGINFNEQPPVAMSDGQLISPEGASTMSDQNGDLLFYSDGNVVYDRDHLQMDNGIQIGGVNGASQSTLIVPFPNDETLFYIFNTRAVFDAGDEYALQYAVVDIKDIDGGTFGTVVTKEKQLFERSTERLTATNPGNFVWLIAHEMGNNTFRAYPVTEMGIGNPVLTSIGAVHDANDAEESQGYMKLSTDGSRLAVALNKGGANYVELFEFDQQTGELSNYIQVDIPNDYTRVYGVEFASNSDKLFVTTNSPVGSGSKLYELKLHDYDKDSIESRIEEIDEETGVNMGAIQTGPDGQIYVARDGEQFLGTITENLDTLSESTYAGNGFDLVTGTSTLGLPNFVQSVFQQTPDPSATVSPACVEQRTTFIGQGTSIIDEFLWTFGDGTSADTDTASHIYTVAGEYTVSLNVSNRCGLDTTITQLVDIAGIPDPPTLAATSIICDNSLILDADTTDTPGLQFLWSTGETSKVIETTSPGVFSVTITNEAGCVEEGSTQVFDGRPPVDLGPNATICQGDALILDTGLPVGNPANIFTWYLDDVDQGTGIENTFTVDSSEPGVYEYVVSVIDGLSGCLGLDTVQVTVNIEPELTYDVTNSECGLRNGQIEILTPDPLIGLTVEYFDQAGQSAGSGASLEGIPAGTYSVTATYDLTGCNQTYVVSVVDDIVPFTIDDATPGQDCEGDSIDVTLSGVTDLSTIIYTLIETNSNSVTSGSPRELSFTVPVPNPGNYTLQIGAEGCIDEITDLVFEPLDKLPLSVPATFDLCSDDQTISVNNADPLLDYFWTGPNGFEDLGPEVVVTRPGTYSVTVSDGNTLEPCDTTAIVEVNISPVPEPVIEPITDGCDGTRQVSVGDLLGDNFSYSWIDNQTGQSIGVAPSITLTRTTDLLLNVRDQQTGCLGEDALIVDVYQPFDVTVSVDQQACQDNNLVVVSATVDPDQPSTYEWFLNEVPIAETSSSVETFNEGLFRAVVTNQDGTCSASGELLITRAPVTPSSILPFYIICPEPPVEEVAVIAPGNFVTYLGFESLTGQPIFETQPGIFEINEEGTYFFELENEFNCWTYDTTVVVATCVPVIYAPNAFSPNAQIQENRTFRLFPTFVGEFEIFIYNRWGELVFYSDDLEFMVNTGWDGTKNGEFLPLGTYAYVIKYRSSTEPENGVIEQPGGVTIVR